MKAFLAFMTLVFTLLTYACGVVLSFTVWTALHLSMWKWAFLQMAGLLSMIFWLGMNLYKDFIDKKAQ